MRFTYQVWSTLLLGLLVLAGCGGVAATPAPGQPAVTQPPATQPGTPRPATGQPPPAQAATGQPATSGQAPTARPTPRASDPGSLLLATTTSVQDSGLLDELIPIFEQRTNYRVKMAAVGSGAAIALGERGDADVVLAHLPARERQFIESGAGMNRRLVMVNDFVLVGPPSDPAQISGGEDVVAALTTIASNGVPFISRGDGSGTHALEQQLWRAANLTPTGQAWHVEAGTGMGQTLQIANERQGYTLSDRGSYLAFRPRVDLEILVEGDPRLLNPYHVIEVNPERYPTANHAAAKAFSDFLLAPETQQRIGDFGRDRYGESLFTPCADNSCGVTLGE